MDADAQWPAAACREAECGVTSMVGLMADNRDSEPRVTPRPAAIDGQAVNNVSMGENDQPSEHAAIPGTGRVTDGTTSRYPTTRNNRACRARWLAAMAHRACRGNRSNYAFVTPSASEVDSASAVAETARRAFTRTPAV
jgi:hypothetical protein